MELCPGDEGQETGGLTDELDRSSYPGSTLKSSVRSADSMPETGLSKDLIIPEVTMSFGSAPGTSGSTGEVQLTSSSLGQNSADEIDALQMENVTPTTSVIVVSGSDGSAKDAVLVSGSMGNLKKETKSSLGDEVTQDNEPEGEGHPRGSDQSARSKSEGKRIGDLDNSIKADLHNLAVMFYRSQAETDHGDEPRLPARINYLVLAIKTDAPHLVEVLLNSYTALKIYSALLYSINLGRDHITKLFLDHPKYQAVQQITEMIKSGTLHQYISDQSEEEIAEDVDESVLAADVTPLMLAAQRNQFEVVQSLLDKGERIEEPHSPGCSCEACTQRGLDELREAKTKLTTFRALASDSYIVLASDDPVFVAFELAQKLKHLAVEEKHFKAEYLQLAENIEDFTGRLLDRVRDGRELDILLNEKLGSGLSSYDNLARLKLAIQHNEKKFVAHPTCQKKLASLWMGDINPEWTATLGRALLFLILLCLCYPFAAILYWIYPYNKLGRFLQIPLVKFAAATGSYFIFVCLVISYAAAEKPAPSGVLCDYEPPVGNYCRQYMLTASDPYINGTSFFIRHHSLGIGTYLLGIWLLGLIWENIKKLHTERFMYFTQNMFNILDFVMLWLFIFSFMFKFIVIGLVNSSLAYFAEKESWKKLAELDNKATSHIYWLNADRSKWVIYDLTTLSEAIFAVASLLSVSKLTFIFTMSERIGPLIISLAKMIEDMLAFMAVFVFMMGAFVVGFHNLFSYFYMSQERIGLQEEDKVSSFSSIEDIVKECFWSIFGLVEMDDNKFYTTDNGYVTAVTGHVMFAFYNWMMIIILINMLIAMMSRSYEFIAEKEDIEWKFARTKLFLEYIREGSTMPAPLNLIPTWKGVYLLHRKFADNWCRRCAGRPVIDRSRKYNRSSNTTSNVNVDLNGRPTNPTMSQMSVKRSERLKYLTDVDNKAMSTNDKKPRPEYLEVMSEIRKRFIQQYGKGKHGESDSTSDDIDQLKQDVSTLRQELTSIFRRQDRERARMSDQLSDITTRLRDTRQLLVSQHRQLRRDHVTETNDVTYRVTDVDRKIADFRGQVASELSSLHRELTELSRESRISLEILRDSVYRLCADVSVIRGPSALARDVISRQAGDDVAGGYVQSSVVLTGPNVGVTSHGQLAAPSMTSVVSDADDVTTGESVGPVSVTAQRVVLKK